MSCTPAPRGALAVAATIFLWLQGALLVQAQVIIQRGIQIPAQVPAAQPAAQVAAGDLSGGVVLSENRELKLKLDQAKKLLEEKNYAESVEFLGKLLADPSAQDFFLKPDPKQPAATSFKAELRRTLGTLPPEGLKTYQLQFGAAARREWEGALGQTGDAAVRQVALRYPHTPSGDEALFLLACLRMDQGRSREAATCLERLRSAVGSQRFEPALSLLSAAAWRRAGDTEKSQLSLKRLKEQKAEAIQVAGKNVPLFSEEGQALEWLDRLLPADNAGGPPAGQGPRRDPATRNVSVPASMPLMAAAWNVEITSDTSQQQTIETAQYSALRRQSPLVPMLHPLVTDELVLMRTARGVQAFDLEAGRRLWSYPSDDDSSNSGVERLLWDAGAYGAIAADGERFYLVENLPSIPPQIAPGVRRTGSILQGPGYNTLCAREYAPPRQGNLRWQIGGDSGGDEPQTAGCFFLGPPLAHAGRLYVLAEVKSNLRLLVLDARTGKQVWSQQLGDVEHAILSDPLRCLAGATPSLCDEFVICPTSCGAVIAVDLATQSLAWAYQYPRTPQSLAARRYGAVIKLDQGDRWIDSTALVAENRVVVTPVESAEVHCLELSTGKLLWKQPRGEMVYAACMEQGSVVMVGKSEVAALRLADGTPGWPERLVLPGGAMPSGRGVSTGAHYYLPLSDASIAQIDLAAGVIASQAKSLREIVPGNLAWHNGRFVSQGTAYLEVFDELAPLERRLKDVLAQRPDDPAALARLGELELSRGRVAEAIDRLRRAHRASPTPKTRQQLTAALLEGVRVKLPAEAELNQELNRLAVQ